MPASLRQSGVAEADAGQVRLSLQRVNRKLTPVEVDELVVTYGQGVSLRSLAGRFEMHEQTVRAHLERCGASLRPVRRLTIEQAEALVACYLGGSSVEALAERFAVSTSTVRRRLFSAGVPLRAH